MPKDSVGKLNGSVVAADYVEVRVEKCPKKKPQQIIDLTAIAASVCVHNNPVYLYRLQSIARVNSFDGLFL